ncbi:MAG: IclR family transcriptional regulator domain-containing protein, partial [Actinomycetes bacterium]
HASALGKALLAFDAAGCATVLAGDMGSRSMTGVTITDPEALRIQLAEVRASGVATEIEEAVLGECSIAAPIADDSDAVAGAIGLVVPATEWPLPPTAVDALRAAARAVSRELGAAHWPPTSRG